MALVYLAYKKNPWKLTWRDPATGQQRARSFGDEATARQFAAAQAMLAAREKELLKRARVRQRKQTVGSPLTVREVFEGYFCLQCTHPTTQISSRYHARPLLALFGERQARGLTVQDMQAFFEAQALRGLSPSTVNRRAAILRAALNWAVRTGKLATNPLEKLRLPQSKSRRIAPPTQAETHALLQHAAPHIRRVIILGMYTGARIGPSELYRLRWVDIDMDAGVARMPSAAKNDMADGRDVPLRDDLLPLLREWHAQDCAIKCPLVIHYRGKAVRSILHGWHSALKAAGITRRIRPYDLRHAQKKPLWKQFRL